MEKIFALDLGDRWTGTAITDSSRSFVHPYQTVATHKLIGFLAKLLTEQTIRTIIVGHPKTMKGTASEQTRTVERKFLQLQEKFPHVQWLLWDERLTSAFAADVQRGKRSKEARLKSHSIAAAFILDSYVIFLKAQQSGSEQK